jgi:hypothetical protein
VKFQKRKLRLPPGNYVTTGKNAGIEYLFDECPQCRKGKHFFWSTEKNQGHCKSCHFKIYSIKQLIKIYGDAGYYYTTPPWLQKDRDPDASPIRHYSSWDVNAWDNERSRNFLISRRVSEEVSRQVPLYYVAEKDALCLTIDPISEDYEKDITLWRGVGGYPPKFIPVGGHANRPTLMSLYGFGLRHVPPGRRAIALFEGAFDVLTTGLLGWAIALLGTSFDKNWMAYLTKFDYIVVWLDPDKAGMGARDKLLPQLKSWGIKYFDLTKQSDKKGLQTGGLDSEPGDFFPQHKYVLTVKKHLLDAQKQLNS